MHTISLDDAGRNVAWLRDELARDFGPARRGSPLSNALRAAERVAAFKPGDIADPRNWYEAVGDLVSMNFLAKALHRGDAGLRAVIRTKQSAFTGGDISLGRAGVPNPARNFAWEVFAAAVCAGLGTVDGDEPDVGVAYRGHRWGVACKVVSSPNIEKLEMRVVEGAKQLEAARCHLGIVLANVSHLVPSDSLFPMSNEAWNVLLARQLTAPQAAAELDEHVSLLAAGLFGRPSFRRRLLRDAEGRKRTRCRLACIVAQGITVVGGDAVLLTAGKWLEFRTSERGESAFKADFEASHLALRSYELPR